MHSGRHQGDRRQLIDEIVGGIVSLELDLNRRDSCVQAEATPAEVVLHFLEHLDVPETLQPEIECTRRALGHCRDKAMLLAQLRQSAEAMPRHLTGSPQPYGDASTVLMLLLERVPVPLELVVRVNPLRRATENADEAEDFVSGVADPVVALHNELPVGIRSMTRSLRGTEQRLTAPAAAFRRPVNAPPAGS